MKQGIINYFEMLKGTLDLLDINEINRFIEIMLEAYQNNANIYIFGNGGSASTASHFACDINKGVSYKLDKRFRVISLTDNIPTIMAYANDVDFSDIFVEQLINFLREGDIAIGISGSGNSKNVIKAIEYANYKGNTTIGITGYDGGILRKIAKHSVNANINNMQISEDIHIILGHLTATLLNEVIKAEIQVQKKSFSESYK